MPKAEFVLQSWSKREVMIWQVSKWKIIAKRPSLDWLTVEFDDRYLALLVGELLPEQRQRVC